LPVAGFACAELEMSGTDKTGSVAKEEVRVLGLPSRSDSNRSTNSPRRKPRAPRRRSCQPRRAKHCACLRSDSPRPSSENGETAPDKRPAGWAPSVIMLSQGLARFLAALIEVRRLFARLEPVSADIRTGLCSRKGIPPGKSLVRPETGATFSSAPADSRRQRPCYPACPGAKPRKVKDYSGGARKAELRRTAWWDW
jgi:hypothetical protein